MKRGMLARGFNLQGLSAKVGSTEAKADIARLVALYGEVNQAASEVVGKAVAPIDWAAYKKTIKVEGFVDELEKAYKSIEFPKFVNNMAEEADEALAKLTTEAKVSMDASSIRVKELEEMLVKLEANRTTEDTTIAQIMEANIEISEEAVEEIKNQEWGKSIGN